MSRQTDRETASYSRYKMENSCGDSLVDRVDRPGGVEAATRKNLNYHFGRPKDQRRWSHQGPGKAYMDLLQVGLVRACRLSERAARKSWAEEVGERSRLLTTTFGPSSRRLDQYHLSGTVVSVVFSATRSIAVMLGAEWPTNGTGESVWDRRKSNLLVDLRCCNDHLSRCMKGTELLGVGKSLDCGQNRDTVEALASHGCLKLEMRKDFQE